MDNHQFMPSIISRKNKIGWSKQALLFGCTDSIVWKIQTNKLKKRNRDPTAEHWKI